MNRGILSEIASSLKRNKLRTFLTGFAIAWGIFMLILLLAAGNGLKNGVMNNFKGQAINSVALYSGMTSLPYKGYSVNRHIAMNEKDLDLLEHRIPEVGEVYPTFSIWDQVISSGKKSTTTSLKAVKDGIENVESVTLLAGRLINERDNNEDRKSLVLCQYDAVALFGDRDPIGKEVAVNGLVYKVVGVYKSEENWQNCSYIPYNTGMKIYNPSNELNNIVFTIDGLTDKKSNGDFMEKLRGRLSVIHDYHPDDENAIYIWNRLQQYLDVLGIFEAIGVFIWIIGLGTLIAGIVGVSNIMLITVKERTKEFGIRKALGAPPRSILSMVIWESLIITSVFGYIGMVMGIGVTETINYFMEKNKMATAASNEMSPDIFLNPTVDLRIVLSALVVLVLAGVLAGYFPAKKAIKIKPVEALRYE